MHHKMQPDLPVCRCHLAGGQCRNSKDFLPLFLAVKGDKNIIYSVAYYYQGHQNVFEHTVDKPSLSKLGVDKIQKQNIFMVLHKKK